MWLKFLTTQLNSVSPRSYTMDHRIPTNKQEPKKKTQAERDSERRLREAEAEALAMKQRQARVGAAMVILFS